MRTVVISSPVATQSGYGHHAREVISNFFDKKPEDWDIKLLSMPWGETPYTYPIPLDWQKHIIPLPLQTKPDIWVQITVPNEFQPVGSYNIGVTAGTEGDICPAEWIDNINKMNLIIVPSNFTKHVFENTAKQHNKSIVPTIKVISEYFDDTIYSHYILITAGLSTTNDSNNSDVYYRMQTESGGSYSDYTSSNYYELRNSVTGTSGGTTGGQSGRLHATSYANFSHNNLEADIGRGMTSFMYIWMPDTSGFSFRARNFTFSFHGATANYYSADVSHHIDDNGVQFKGIKIYPSGGNFDAGRFTLYGFKK